MIRGRTGVVLFLAASVLAITVGAAHASRAYRTECQGVARVNRHAYVCIGTIPTQRTMVALNGRNGFHDRGTAWITFGIHETDVVVRLSRPIKSMKPSAFLRVGGCWGKASFSLGRVIDGRRLARIGPLPRVTGVSVVIRAHTTPTRNAVVACGVIPRR
jgi:hypothetical protein